MTLLTNLSREKQKARNYLFILLFLLLFLLNHTAIFYKKQKTNGSVIVIQLHTLINSKKELELLEWLRKKFPVKKSTEYYSNILA